MESEELFMHRAGRSTSCDSCFDEAVFDSPPAPSSRDSGYGSKSSTPENPSRPRTSLDTISFCLDGNGPDSPDAFSKIDNASGQEPQTPQRNRLPEEAPPETSGSVPGLQLVPLRPTVPFSFFSTPSPIHGSQTDSRKSTHTPNSVQSPSLRHSDRFVHPRSASSKTISLSDRFHLTKPANDLSPAERFLRHSQNSRDVFSQAPPRFSLAQTITEERQALHQTLSTSPVTRARTTLDSVDLNSNIEYTPSLGFNNDLAIPRGVSTPLVNAVNNGQGVLIQSGTNAPYFTSDFVRGQNPSDHGNMHRGRLAAALDVDLATRLLECNLAESPFGPASSLPTRDSPRKATWNGTTWVKEGQKAGFEKQKEENIRPLRILSAPELRDDFYCSVLAYSPTCDTIAVGLGDLLYRWSEMSGAKLLNGNNMSGSWLTSLAFSSTQGGKSILAFGRSNGMLGLLSMYESGMSRMLVQESAPISCLSWRPTYSLRPSKHPRNGGKLVKTEDLLVGDDIGNVLYYVVEWPDSWEAERDNWRGEMTLVSRISIHYQQVCGLAWSIDGKSFATGGNDNLCCFFYTCDVLPRSYRAGGSGKQSLGQPRGPLISNAEGSRMRTILSNGSEVHERIHGDMFVRRIGPGLESWHWEHGAAVKAIAFCPWQEGLVATGGGSNDKCIHFFHTTSGAALATIFVSSQVTSLIWSTTRREIAATFGFAHPGHSVRIAVYSWPDCKQVSAIAWEGKHRALYGVSCSKGPYWKSKGLPNKKKDGPDGQTLREGCIAVAASDGSIQFYELWPSNNRPITGGPGMLGGSDILEDLEGVQKEGDVIR